MSPRHRRASRYMTVDASNPNLDRAWRAAHEFAKLTQPLTSLVRELTGDPRHIVKASANTQTNGTVIEIRPPIELGDRVDHDRSLCGKRDDKDRPLCPGCYRLDKVFAFVYHEVAHKVFESFDTVRERDRMEFTKRAVMANPGLAGTRLAKLQGLLKSKEAVQTFRDGGYIAYAGLISKHLPTIFNALEDARVNREMIRVRSGYGKMMSAFYYEVFETGADDAQGGKLLWKDQPLDMQAIIAVFCLASGLQFAQYLDPAVSAALDDPDLRAEVAKVDTSRSAAAIYRLSFPVLEHLRRLGFCRLPDDVEDDPKPKLGDASDAAPSGDDDDNDDGDDQESNGTSQSDASDSKDQPNEKDGDQDRDEDVHGDDNTPDEDTSSEGDDQGGDDAEDDDSLDENGDDDGHDDDDSGSGSSGGEADDEAPQDGSQGGSGAGSQHADPESPGSADQGAGSQPQDFAAPTSDPEEVGKGFAFFAGHGDEQTGDVEPAATAPEQGARDDAMEVAVMQQGDFDSMSTTVAGVTVNHYPNGQAWGNGRYGTLDDYTKERYGLGLENIELRPNLVNSGMLNMRRYFANNRKAKIGGEHKAGKIVPSRLHSVKTGNVKVFGKEHKPGRKSHFVLLAVDISGSTSGSPIRIIRQLGLALGDMLNGSGVKYAVYAHSGGPCRDGDIGGLMMVEVNVVKEETQPWDAAARESLAMVNSYGNNLDGHMMEFCRKRCDESSATDKHILYLTDGAMPEANRYDETEVLVRELKECARRGYDVIGAGIHTSSPERYGLPTCRLDTIDDIPNLLRFMEARMVGG
jgi:hypothetical protein